MNWLREVSPDVKNRRADGHGDGDIGKNLLDNSNYGR